tara:strand:+ start:1372 stop:2346 length:975 start_codon:yes stop_codon:yes gene_type:complete
MSELAQVLRHLIPIEVPESLVDASTNDDAAVYSLANGRALVVTLDFFTPLVDEPYDFGRIAAANALSDIYAMGAQPLFALNLLGFPRKLLEEGIVEEILRGGSDMAREAGIPIMGGHSIDDPEPKYGLVVIGDVQEDALITNTESQVGDTLVLTKALGTGIITTAIKVERAPSEVVDAAVVSMTTLNRYAANAMIGAGVRAATDVSGYGLLGHLSNILVQSGVAAEIDISSVPILPGVENLIAEGHVPCGTQRNLEDTQDRVDFGISSEFQRIALADAQTSGGMLISAPPNCLGNLMDRLKKEAPDAAIIGRITKGDAGTIKVL